MTNPEIVSEEVMSLTEVKEAIKKIEKRDSELGILSQRTKDYVNSFTKLNHKDHMTLSKSLKGLDITRLKSEHIKKISDFLPIDIEDLKVVLQAYPVTLTKKDMQAIIDEVKKIA
ncbi:hypothetical protein HN385_04620 [archaeon]|jgi:DNA-directed RNA polymerase subunit F|nr:hypothetical protein [archaeon]MBT3450426.1 hypothetical protein [archaeon]MBT6869169.1 hypothetical protein [archaeon]MBT7192816.1 hypothetical protein [archaeon]MBT7381356.1 hypothetical protein [archaeon]